ncbi:CBM35 domain-containing protein [Spirosoma foliorum]|uniref:CBM6 domain-containing protein n=1 Tax=Spirosoma foliorum TaxID=2710596 RepID=A0A7G5H011_9BACT|nr:CBM35 domain-containing protein [Spirosoma foliorum]QMW04453.1 hypothetical protein H3H32_05790 [Spirosoma foliorum]
MALGTQLIRIRRTSDGQVIYLATALRNTADYPLNSAGQAAFEAAVGAGSFTLTVDNGAIIPAGTIPPLIKPGAVTSPAFSQKIQAEDAAGTGTSSGPAADNNVRGPYATSSDYLVYTVTGIPTTASNYTLIVRYQSVAQASGIASLIINGAAPIDFPIEGTDGGMRTYTATISLTPGNNTIRIQGKSGSPFFQDYILVTRPAG